MVTRDFKGGLKPQFSLVENCCDIEFFYFCSLYYFGMGANDKKFFDVEYDFINMELAKSRKQN